MESIVGGSSRLWGVSGWGGEGRGREGKGRGRLLTADSDFGVSAGPVGACFGVAGGDHHVGLLAEFSDGLVDEGMFGSACLEVVAGYEGGEGEGYEGDEVHCDGFSCSLCGYI